MIDQIIVKNIFQLFINFNQYRYYSMQQKQKINQSQKKIQKYIFSLKKVLGEGSYATVYLGRTISNNQPVAVKVINKKIFANAYNLKNIHLEIQIMKKIQHKNIVKLLDVYQTSNNMYIVTQFCEEGDLATWLKKKKKGTQKQALKFLKDILSGFKYLVDRQITHRDLKPANILLKNSSCKIGDFGFAKNLESGQSTVMKSIVGTPLYMSPQILTKSKYTNKSDIWSVGLIYYELLHGNTPWPAKNEIQLINGIYNKKIPFDSWISEKSKEFIKKCLEIKESDRFSWQQAFNHDLINQIPNLKLKKLSQKQQNKQNINTNLKSISQRSISIKIRRDISEHKLVPVPQGDKDQSGRYSKTPTKSKLKQILALTPTNKQKSAIKSKIQLQDKANSSSILIKLKLK